MSVEIPEKLYFRIGEAARITKTPQYVLRFWESQFPALKPKKSSTGQRMFRRRDLELILEIKKLLYEQGFTIDGARKKLGKEARQHGLPFQDPGRERLREVGRELKAILVLLSRKKS